MARIAEVNISGDRAQEILGRLTQLGLPSSEVKVDRDYLASFIDAVGCE